MYINTYSQKKKFDYRWMKNRGSFSINYRGSQYVINKTSGRDVLDEKFSIDRLSAVSLLITHSDEFPPGLLDGLLLPAILARLTAQFLRSDKVTEPEHQDARENLATGHLLLQREAQLRSHDNGAEQTAQNNSGR